MTKNRQNITKNGEYFKYQDFSVESGGKHRKGEQMEGTLIGIMDTAILKYCFGQWCMDHDIDTDNPDELRCDITVYSHYVQNVLSEQFEVEQKEGEK